MKPKLIIVFFVLLTALCPLFAADDSKKAAAPSAAGLFPPELVFLAQDRIALTPEQLAAFRARLGKTQQSSGGAPASVADLLTPEQLAKLGELGMEITKDHAVFVKLEEESGNRINAKAGRVKAGAQKWADSGRDASAITKALEEQFKPLMEADKVFEAEAVLDGALKLLAQDGKSAGSPPSSASSDDPTKRLREKLARVEPAVHRVMDSGRDATEFRKAIEEEFKPLIEAGKVAEAEVVVDRVLAALTKAGVSTEAPTVPDPAVQQRVAAKVERVTAAVQKWMASGRDPSAILKTIEKTGHLIQAGKVVEAEPELDRALEELSKDATSTASPAASAEGAQQRVDQKVKRVIEGAHQWEASGRDTSAIAKTMQEKVKPLIDAGKFTEAEAEIDRVLAALAKQATSAASPATPDEAVHQRVAAKVERVTQAVKKMAESGSDPSAILKTMGEKVGPLLDAGKFIEADAELDRVLKLLTQDASPAPDNSKEERKAPSPEAAASLEQVATGFRLAEGPVWDGESLIFSDVFPSKIHKLGSDGNVTTMRTETRKGAGMAFDSQRRLLICEVDGFRVTRIEKDGTEKTLAESYEGKKLNGPNDLVVDARDGIYFTDPLFLNKDKREQDKEAVYYISPEGKVLRVADDLEKPNGIALTLDGKTLFVADSAKSKLRAYPVKENGTLGEGRDFGSVNKPDGVRVDLDGKVYAAGRTGIAVWDASGKSLGTLKTPTTPSSLAFGDADRRTMFITTSPSVFKIRIDQALKMLTADEPSVAKAPPPAASAAQAPAPTPAASAEAVHQRIVAKVERIKEGVHKLAEGGGDPSAILKTMQEKVGPLLDAGKVIEAEPELDRVLEQLNKEAK